MSAPGSSRSIPFRSKKRLMDSPCPKAERRNPNSPSMDVPTPEKPPESMLTRSKNRGVALSVKEIRQAANSRRRSEDPNGETRSVKNKLVFSPDDSSSSLPFKVKIATMNAEKEKLPEKYEILIEFFDGMDNAIRLSKLKSSMPTFSNISAKIEYLTERRFLYSHLAQLKHILPEAIEVKRVLMLDEKTSCMKPDLHVTINPGTIPCAEKSKSESKHSSLRTIFRARLADFVKAHPQGEEVPEEPLPELFNRKKESEGSSLLGKHASSNLSWSSQKNYRMASDEKTISASALSPGNLSANVSSNETSGSYISTVKPLEVNSSSEEMASTPAKTTFQAQATSTPLKPVPTPAKADSTSVVSTPAKVASTPAKVVSTPPELASTPARLTSALLAAQPLKGSSGHAGLYDASANPPNKLMRRPSALRPLNFEPFTEDKKAVEVADDEVTNEASEEGTSSDDDILSILPETLLQSIREQEKKAIEDQDPAISQAKRRCKMIACLPKLFDVTHFLFQSIRRSVITKEELVHKIIAGHSDICDRREVEEQLNLMLELLPEWITEKRSFSGDLLICINKTASPEAIRARLEEENKQGMAPVS